jgi:ubiquinone/menaquinone biosynthesis C-methylase UbiE
MKTSKQFYKELGAEGLAKRKEAIHTKKELIYLKKFLNKKQRILDLACGYGRFAIPLAKQRYNVEGLDISPNLLRKAKMDAKKQGLNIRFIEGDMTNLPYKDNSFDAIICMWSAFAELHRKSDQIKALKEMLRVLDKNGLAILEMPKPERVKKKVVILRIGAVEGSPMYCHNKKTLTNLMKKFKILKYKIFIDNFGGRDRLFLQFWKRGR